MTDPDWAKIIHYLYENEGKLSLEFDPGNSMDDTLEEVYKIVSSKIEFAGNADSPRGLSSVLGRLEDLDFVDWSLNVTTGSIVLQPEGFELAHERELKKEQHHLMEEQKEANQRLATFTVILGGAALIQATESVLTAPDSSRDFLIVTYLLVLIVLFVTIGGVGNLATLLGGTQ